MANKLRPLKILSPTNTQTGTVIFLHGSGDTGLGVREWVKMLLKNDLVFPHLKVMFPTAPLMPYTPNGGEPSNVWFDRDSISPDVPENLESISSMAKELTDLITSEVSSGIPHNRIVIGGFSMGGAMAMHMGYRFMPQVGGVFALSSFLNHNSTVYQHLTSDTHHTGLPPLFMCHGARDDLVPLSWGDQTFKELGELGVEGSFHVLDNALHELKRGELLKLYDWITQHLPDNGK